MSAAHGLHEPFSTLFDRGGEDHAEGISLPDFIRDAYDSQWTIPTGQPGVYVYSNFVVSRDGRISFGEDGHSSGAEVSRHLPHDQWIMALLRARADAVMIGDGIVRREPYYLCRVEDVFPSGAMSFAKLRQLENRRERYLCVVVSLEGEMPADAAVFTDEGIDTLIATTSRGEGACRAIADSEQSRHCTVFVSDSGDGGVDLPAVLSTLKSDYQVDSLLCEGGAILYGAMLSKGLIDDEFLTLSPIVVGPPVHLNERRPSLVDGTAFTSSSHPTSTLISVHRSENYLFIRSRYNS